MSRRSHKNYRRCGSRITFSGTFPANPNRGQTGIVGGIVWVWDGSSWDVQSITGYDGEIILVDDNGAFLITDNYSVKVI